MHGHAHDHGGDFSKAFAWGVALNVIYVIAEAVGGFWIDSMALLADAGHNLSDVAGLLLAWGGHALAKAAPTPARTYGWRGATILAALLNALLLLVAIGAIAWEAIQRFWEPADIAGGTVVAVALVGVAINTATALLFLGGRERDVNIRGAFLHMAADAGVSAAVVVAGAAIWRTGATWIDPVTSLLVAAVVLYSTWGLLRESTNLAMQAVPPGVDARAVADYFRSLSGVEAMHDLHIWAMSTTETALTVHLLKPRIEDEDELLNEAAADLQDRFGIEHVTIQIERSAETQCRQADDQVV